MLGLIINRITGSKEVATLLSKLGHGISYNDIRTLNNPWAQTVTHNSIAGIPSGFMKQKPLHIAIDNSDGKQETLTGSKTTHFTNGIIFQVKSNKEQVAIAKDKKAGELVQEPIDYGVYKITKKMSPPVITAFKDRNERKNLDWDLKRNIVWVLAGAVGCTLTDNTVEKRAPLGSWTAFMKSVTNVETSKVHIDYLEVVPFPPKDNVCKWYLDQMVKVTQEMDLEFIFLHSDEAVHSKIMILKWINQGDYDRIVPLMGGFHTILVKLKLIHKRFGALGMRDWWIDSNAISEGSVDKAAEGKHYSRAIRLHKQSFEALLRYRFEKLRNERDIHVTLKKDLEQLIKMPSFETLETVINNEYFEEVLNDLLYTNGPQSYQFVSYIKDVSLLLSIISSVRENNIERHLEAERALLPDLFAFGHPNYARFLTFQHIMLEQHRAESTKVWQELIANGFGGSLSGQKFSSKHGDLIIETTINREVKVRGGPMQGGFSTNTDAVDTFIKTSHVIAKLRFIMNKKLGPLSSATHKETTPGAKKTHEKTIKRMVSGLDNILDPFAPGPARHMKTGVLIDENVIQGLMKSTDVGERFLKDFIEDRITNNTESRISFFAPISNPKIRTGLEKKAKEAKVINVLKEDKQAFGLLVGKFTSSEEVHRHPLTSLPLALAAPDGDFRQGSKAVFRNYLIEETDCVGENPKDGSVWIFDGMAAVRSLQPKSTWKDYAIAFLMFCTPPESAHPKQVIIAMDKYGQKTIKELTQQRRRKVTRHVLISSPLQTMPKSSDWQSFLSSSENKKELIRFLVNYYEKNYKILPLKYPLVINDGDVTWRLSTDSCEKLRNVNHQEADTRVVYFSSISDNKVIVNATDTDILVLLLFAFSCLKPLYDWQMRISADRYICVRSISNHYGNNVCNILPAFHSLTGCDTTSHPFGVGKIKPFKKMLKLGKECLLEELGTSIGPVGELHDATKFLQTVLYPGKDDEDIVQTRVRMYEKMKEKCSSKLIPDPNSSSHHLKRADLQTYIWRQCMRREINYPDVEGRGWIKDGDGIKPLWFTCSQLPQSLSKKKSSELKEYQTDNEASDNEVKMFHGPARKRKRMRKYANKDSNQENRESDDDSDTDSEEDSSWAWLSSSDNTTDDSDSDFEI